MSPALPTISTAPNAHRLSSPRATARMATSENRTAQPALPAATRPAENALKAQTPASSAEAAFTLCRPRAPDHAGTPTATSALSTTFHTAPSANPASLCTTQTAEHVQVAAPNALRLPRPIAPDATPASIFPRVPV